jgi:hypothetical protein
VLTPLGDEPQENSSQRRLRLLREAQKRYRDRHPDRASEARRRSEAKETSKEKRRTRQKRHHLQTRLKAIAELGNKCSICEQSFHHAAMDFHHLDPTTKQVKGKGLPCNNSWKSVEKELVKTILLCANCHRIHHYKERNPDE